MTGEQFKAARGVFSAATGRKLSQSDMAKLVGLSDPGGNGADTIRKWENGDGPSGPVARLVSLVLDGLTTDGSNDPVADFMIEWILNQTDAE